MARVVPYSAHIQDGVVRLDGLESSSDEDVEEESIQIGAESLGKSEPPMVEKPLMLWSMSAVGGGIGGMSGVRLTEEEKEESFLRRRLRPHLPSAEEAEAIEAANARAHVCGECGAGFPRPGRLRKHMIMHSELVRQLFCLPETLLYLSPHTNHTRCILAPSYLSPRWMWTRLQARFASKTT